MTQHRQTVDVLYISGHGGAAKKYIIETAIVVPFISLERIDFNSAFLWRYEPVRRTGKSDDWLTIFLRAQ